MVVTKTYPLQSKKTQDSACFTETIDNLKTEAVKDFSTSNTQSKHTIAANKVLKNFNRTSTMNNQDLEHLEQHTPRSKLA